MSAVDFVGRFESLEDDLKQRWTRSGSASTRRCRAPRPPSAKPHKPYRDYYDGDTREIVGDWYAREIELLDYAF